MMKKNVIFLGIILVGTVHAQFYNTGQAPTRVIWNQINTENYQIIYPSGLYEKANQAANMLEFMYDKTADEYNVSPRKISVLLYNESVQSNGYVTLAPRRSEWITTPPEKIYAQNWLHQLALHEGRHIVQIDKLEQGLTRILRIVFGEMGHGAVLAYLPLWFMEGDAVVHETAYSSTGRGRQPDFSRELRAIETDNAKRFSYDQAYLGSYDNNIPNYYKYGYQMVSYGKLKYGEKIWNETLEKVGCKPWLAAPFYFGLRQQGAGSKVNLYHETFDSLKKLWNKDIEDIIYTKESNIHTSESDFYTQYLYPKKRGGDIYAVRSGIDDITRFVRINDSLEEEVVHTPGVYTSNPVSFGERYILWSEYQPHPRWEQVSYSVIKVYDHTTGKERQLTDKSRLFSPDLSPSGKEAVAVKVDLQNHYSLAIIDVTTGRILKEISSPDGSDVFNPKWLNSGKLVYIAMNKRGKRIVALNLKTLEAETLFDAEYTNIDHLSPGPGVVYFSFDREMARNVYAVKTNTKEVFKVTASRHGADFASYSSLDNRLYYSDYKVKGYALSSMNADSIHWIPLVKARNYNYAWAEALSSRAKVNVQDTDLPLIRYDSLRYKRALHLLNPHSWIPFYIDSDELINSNSGIYPGLTVLSQNKLSTFTSALSYYYRNKTHHLKPAFTWAGLFPVFELSAILTDKSRFYSVSESVEPPAQRNNFHSISLKTYVPLNFTKSRFTRIIRPELQYRYMNSYYFTDNTYHVGYDLMEYGIFTAILGKMALRDIQYPLGMTLQLKYNHPLRHSSFFTNSIILAADIYFPGLRPHHGFKLNYSQENHQKKAPVLSNRISLPRGFYSPDYYYNLQRGSLNYIFPLFNPDWTLGPVAYIKRFHASVFCDVGQVQYPVSTENGIGLSAEFQYSFGTTISAEMHFFRFFIPFVPQLTIVTLPETNETFMGLGINVLY